jgi:iron(III) transport system permease protein
MADDLFKGNNPLLLPSVISVWIWSSMHVTRALSIPVMLYSQDSRIISVLIWDLWANGEVSSTCAIGVLLMLFLMIVLSMGRLLAMRKAREL